MQPSGRRHTPQERIRMGSNPFIRTNICSESSNWQDGGQGNPQYRFESYLEQMECLTTTLFKISCIKKSLLWLNLSYFITNKKERIYNLGRQIVRFIKVFSLTAQRVKKRKSFTFWNLQVEKTNLVMLRLGNRKMRLYAQMAELVDAIGSNPITKVCGFKSHFEYH